MASLLNALGQGSMGMADMAWNIKCREEDMAFRELEKKWRERDELWRRTDNLRRKVDEKAKQLEQISSLSALFAGFALVAIVEISPFPTTISVGILVSFGLAAALAVGLMITAMLTSTFMLVAIHKYDTSSTDPHYPSFDHFWSTRCESDWRFAFSAFNLGIPVFLLVLALVGWITFDDHQGTIPAALSMTCVAGVAGFVYYTYTYRKWGGFLRHLDFSEREESQGAGANFGATRFLSLGMTKIRQDRQASTSKMGRDNSGGNGRSVQGSNRIP